MAIPNNMTDCYEVLAVLLLDRDHLQTFLPDNYTAADSRNAPRLVGQEDLPVETGRGMLVFAALDCAGGELDLEGYAWSVVNIAVDPSESPSGLPERTVEFQNYFLEYWTTGEHQREIMSDLGLQALAGIMEAEPTASGGTARLESEKGLQFSVSVTAQGATAQTGAARDPLIAETGIGYLDLRVVDQLIMLGAVESCSFGTGTLLAQITGAEDCTGIPNYAFIRPLVTFESTIYWVPPHLL